jgi:hypothetical protein
MMIIIRLTLAVFLLAGLAAANEGYEAIDTTNFVNRADSYQGRLVAVTGKVCAVSADGKSIQLFDAQSRALIDVTLTQLKKSQRRTLMLNPVRRVAVYGRVEMKNGKFVIDAHQVTPLAEASARRQPSSQGKRAGRQVGVEG